MNKQEIENKLEEIFSQTNYELVNNMIEDKGYIQSLMKKSFNFALELAAEKSKILNCSYLSDSLNNKEEVLFIVDKQSILNLKL